MNFLQLVNDMKRMDDAQAQSIASSYGIQFTREEISLLKPLLDDLSVTWLWNGIPSSFIEKVEHIIGKGKTEELLNMYEDFK